MKDLTTRIVFMRRDYAEKILAMARKAEVVQDDIK